MLDPSRGFIIGVRRRRNASGLRGYPTGAEVEIACGVCISSGRTPDREIHPTRLSDPWQRLLPLLDHCDAPRAARFTWLPIPRSQDRRGGTASASRMDDWKCATGERGRLDEHRAPRRGHRQDRDPLSVRALLTGLAPPMSRLMVPIFTAPSVRQARLAFDPSSSSLGSLSRFRTAALSWMRRLEPCPGTRRLSDSAGGYSVPVPRRPSAGKLRAEQQFRKVLVPSTSPGSRSRSRAAFAFNPPTPARSRSPPSPARPDRRHLGCTSVEPTSFWMVCVTATWV